MVNSTLRKSAILIESKKPWSYDFHSGHFICTTINLLEFIIGSSLFNYFLEIIITMTGVERTTFGNQVVNKICFGLQY